MANLSEIYNWFMTGKKPTQAQFWASWGSFRHKNDSIPQSEVENLSATLNAKAEKLQFEGHKTDPLAHAELFAGVERISRKGQAYGYAPLDEFGILVSSFLKTVNDLVTGGIDAVLTAEMGKQLQIQINGINALLSSDDIDLDTVQELVDAIKEVETSLETILVNDVVSGGVTKALTAEQGKVLFALIQDLESNKASKNNPTFTGSVKVPDAANENEAVNLGQLMKNRFFSISASQTTNLIQIAFKDKVTITALEAITNVDSFSDFVVWKGNTALTARTTIAQVNTDIAALTSSEVLAGYTVQFKLNLIAGQSNASAILKTVKS